jgi:tetratricopeptide (TPR) repeat protein
MNFYGDFLWSIGALRRAEALKRQAMALDALAFVHPMNLNQILIAQGRYAEAAAMGERAVALQASGPAFEQLLYARLRLGDLDAARAALEKTCADFGEEASCQLDRALWLAASGSRDEARTVADRYAEQPSAAWGGVPAYAQAAGVYSFALADYVRAAALVRSSFGVIVWAPTLPLLWGDGGARLPEELSRDPQWLDAWNDQRAQEVMALYRANIAAFRRGE